MKNKLRVISLLLALALAAANWHTRPLSAAEASPEGKPPPKPLSVTIRLRTPDGQPASARANIIDIKGLSATRPASGIVISGAATVPLLPGSYTLRLDGGLRVQPLHQILKIDEKSTAFEIMMKPYAPVDAAGWQMGTPYHIIQAGEAPNSATMNQLVENAASRGLRLLACDGLWQLANASGTVYSAAPDGPAQLAAALAAASEEGVLILQAWTAQRPGLGRFFAIEASPVFSPHRHVPANELNPAFAAVRDRGGLSIYAHPSGLAGGAQIAGGLLFDTVAGPLYDLLDIGNAEADMAVWYALLNMGYRIPAIACSSSISPGASEGPELGVYLAHPQSRLPARAAFAALKQGRSVISNGPFLRFFVEHPPRDDAPPPAGRGNDWATTHSATIGGQTFPSARPRTVWLDAYACSNPVDSVKRVELIYNGEVLRSQELQPGQKTMRVGWEGLVLDRSGWLIARYYSHSEHFRACTNPVYIADPQTPRPEPATARCKISVVAGDSGAPLPATITAFNRGTRIGVWQFTGAELELLLPATASLTLTAAGYRDTEYSLFADGQPRAYVESLRQQGRLAQALTQPAAYQKMRGILADLRLSVRLPKD